MKKLKGIVSLCMASAMLVACNSSDDKNTEKNEPLVIAPSLGIMNGVNVSVYRRDGTTIITSGTLDESGQITLSIPASLNSKAKIVVVEGNVDATYFDEALATTVPFPAGQKMHALVPAGLSKTTVTPLTEIAFRLAEVHQLLPLAPSVAKQLNDIVKNSLAPQLEGILSLPELAGSASANSFNDDNAGRYALILAALAELANSSGAPALDALNALAKDAADGIIDAANNGIAINAPYVNFLNEMSSALDTAAQKWGYSGDAQVLAPASTTLDASNIGNNGGNGGNDGNDGNDGSSGSALACFDASLQAVGTTVKQVILSSSPEGDIRTTADTELLKNTTYNGNNAVEAKSDVVADASQDFADSESTTYTYTKLADGNKTLRTFGTITETNVPGFGKTTVTTVIEPYMEKRFDLTVNQSYTQTYTVNVESDIPGAPSTSTEVTDKTTYLGRETVTVPAGTFHACKMRTTSSGDETTTWFAPGNGIMVKQTSGDQEDVLESASINGNPI